MDSTADLDDPFSYRPLKRSKSGKPISKSRLPATSGRKQAQTKTKSPTWHKTTSQKSPTGRVGSAKKTTNPVTPEKGQKSIRDIFAPSPQKQSDLNDNVPGPSKSTPGYCPVCQMPLSLLASAGISSAVHLAECCEMSLSSSLQSCPDGLECRNAKRQHYIHYNHRELARHRDLGFFDNTTQLVTESPPEENNGSSNLDKTGEKPVEKDRIGTIPPPLMNSTPAASMISPIVTKGTKRNSARTDVEPENRGGYVQNFLQSLFGSKKSTKEHKEVTERASQYQPNFTLDSSVRDNNLEGAINKAVNTIENDVQVISEDENDGCDLPPGSPSGGRSRNPPSSSRFSPLPDSDGTSNRQKERSEPQETPGKRKSTSNLRYSEEELLCTKSPFNIRAIKDSEELDLSVDLNQEIKCKKIKLKVPLKCRNVPVEVSAEYRDKDSPSKQAKITAYFNHPDSVTDDEADNGGSEDTRPVFKRPANKSDSVMKWKEIFSKKPHTQVMTIQTQVTEEAMSEEHANGQVKRKCPFYKKMPGTSFAVDAFNFGKVGGVKHYFLSHYHYDHYIGLSKRWSDPIVCSSITARLIINFLKVSERLVTVLEPGESRVIDRVEVTGVDANHCPGSLMFIFRLTSGQTILHTGDFRACADMESDPVFWNHRRIDSIYLDTTYCRPEYDFPIQHLVIDKACEEVNKLLSKFPHAAILVGAYTIGKERIFKGIVKDLECKVWANTQRQRTWSLLQDKEISSRVVKDRRLARVHVVEARKINWKGLDNEFASLGVDFDHIMGIKPTGWTHKTGSDPGSSLQSIRTITRGRISFLEVPYSEHSSYSELKRFIQFLGLESTRQIIPTVNLRQRQEMNSYFDSWIKEGKQRGVKF